MKTTGSSKSGESNSPANHDQMRRSEKDASEHHEEGWESNKGNNINGSLKQPEGKDKAFTGKKGGEGESKSIHVEDWENDPYANQVDEDNIRGELNSRSGKGKESGRGNEVMNENTGSTRGSGTQSADNKRGNGDRESGNDESIGVP